MGAKHNNEHLQDYKKQNLQTKTLIIDAVMTCGSPKLLALTNKSATIDLIVLDVVIIVHD